MGSPLMRLARESNWGDSALWIALDGEGSHIFYGFKHYQQLPVQQFAQQFSIRSIRMLSRSVRRLAVQLTRNKTFSAQFGTYSFCEAKKPERQEFASPYAILGVSSQASGEEIKARYYELAQQFHPDKNPQLNTEKFKEIGQAYNLLKDPARKEELDQQLRRGAVFYGNTTKYSSRYHYGHVHRKSGVEQHPQFGKTQVQSPYSSANVGQYFSTGMKWRREGGEKGKAQARVRQRQGVIRNILLVGGGMATVLGAVEVIVRVYEFNRGTARKHSDGVKGLRMDRMKSEQYIL